MTYGEDVKRSVRANLKQAYYPRIALEGLKKTTKKLGQKCRSSVKIQTGHLPKPLAPDPAC
jgi:hypothetical protein